MKQFKLVMPENKAWDFSAWSFSNEVKVILSWLKGGDFFDSAKLTVICQASDEVIEKLKGSDFKQYLVNGN